MSITPNTIIRDGKYRILHQIGEGGMACVWLAEERTFGSRQVAINEPPYGGLFSIFVQKMQKRLQPKVKAAPSYLIAR